MTEKKWPNVPPETKMKGERKRAEYGTGEDVERRHDWEREHAGRSRPHIAPCSCELHVALRETTARLASEMNQLANAATRIRELEAELAKDREKSDAWHARFVQQHVVRSLYDETLARAEKAEAELTQLKSPANRWWLDIVARAEKAEARVAELERYKTLTEQAEAIEAREREAD